jgi:endogenous inhibitor of DNA gyrase (YacG/DUF329 family)
MKNLTTPCPICGWPVLLIAGATFIRDTSGSFVLRCPRCEAQSSSKLIAGRVYRTAGKE